MDLRHPYLREQLIAYIGNKRALLPFLREAFAGLPGMGAGRTFSDPFAGSGAVSRLARMMGFAVQANDWEPYSFWINSCHLGVAANELPALFNGRGGLDQVLLELAALPAPKPEERYISRHYAPRSTAEADWRTERLFYSAENAARIDAIRNRIEEMYPGTPADGTGFKEKAVLLAPLLYEAATHTNTSGVFKACHKGFGGHGKDALSRIMAPIRPRPPVLTDSPAASRVFCEDAERFVAAHPADVCYLDPPYATHQYGSNYFMLNTIALWDKPEVSAERGPDGRLREKAGIRKDWTRTRSAFCYKASAAEAFRRVVEAADCRFLCVSYSNEGLVSPEELADILSETGGLSVLAREYVKYPGGRQSAGRVHGNLEMLFVVDRAAPCGGRRDLDGVLLRERLRRLAFSAFHPGRIRETFGTEGNAIIVDGPDVAATVLPMAAWHRFEDPAAVGGGLDARGRAALADALSRCRMTDAREELGVVLDFLTADGAEPAPRLLKDALRALRSIAHRTYREEFSRALARMKAYAGSRTVPAFFSAGLARIEETAVKRFGAASRA